MKDLYNFANIIKSLRQANGWTQEQVANKMGISYQSYQNYERGITLPTLVHFVKLADLFEVSLDYLIDGKNY